MNKALRIPPLLLVVLLAAAMYGVSLITPSLAMPVVIRLAVACIVFLAGLGIVLSGLVAFRLANTSVDPVSPDKASALVETGIYRLTRNPMYVGFLMMLLAWTVFLANLFTLAACLVFFWYINRFQIPEEERALTSMFQQEFTVYCSRVRRWL